MPPAPAAFTLEMKAAAALKAARGIRAAGLPTLALGEY